ncbi:MAG TPA: hypothetical protein VMR96_07805 [Solirubrobacterales bacterium]|nr:hypothetical protein [Solirubrobacterales bacterium]
MTTWKRVSTAALAVAVLSAFSSLATAEVSQKKGVRVSVTGSMSPVKLPRTGTAPIAVSVAGHITTTKAGTLPKLTKIAIAINRGGKLDRKGLPLCRLGHISPSTTQEALTACRSSLIGEGSFSADVRIPEQSPFPSEGKVLAFNGKLRGKPAIFAHIYGTRPVPTSYVLPFSITSTKGTFGTLLEASLPQVTGEWGFVTGIALDLDRQFSSGGKRHTYLAAGCPAPKGFTTAAFPLARTTFSFDGGLSLSSTLNRSCKVR